MAAPVISKTGHFKPHTFGHHFELWMADDNSVAYVTFCGPAARHEGPHKILTKTLTKTVSVTMGGGNSTIEVKDGVIWTFGAVPVHAKKAAAAVAFKAKVDAAVIAIP